MNDNQTIGILKGLVIDGVNKAKSGHPGGAMSSMDFAYILFTEFLNFDPDDSQWMGRDRFILSAGHESMLQYSMLHLMGWLPMDELKNSASLTAKHPATPNTNTPKALSAPLDRSGRAWQWPQDLPLPHAISLRASILRYLDIKYML